jgi:hypothetical protein
MGNGGDAYAFLVTVNAKAAASSATPIISTPMVVTA